DSLVTKASSVLLNVSLLPLYRMACDIDMTVAMAAPASVGLMTTLSAKPSAALSAATTTASREKPRRNTRGGQQSTGPAERIDPNDFCRNQHACFHPRRGTCVAIGPLRQRRRV